MTITDIDGDSMTDAERAQVEQFFRLNIANDEMAIEKIREMDVRPVVKDVLERIVLAGREVG